MRNAKKTLSLVMIAIFTTFIVLSGIPAGAVTTAAAKAQVTKATAAVVKVEKTVKVSNFNTTTATTQLTAANKEVAKVKSLGKTYAKTYTALNTRTVAVAKKIASAKAAAAAKAKALATAFANADKAVIAAENAVDGDKVDLVGDEAALANAQGAVTAALETVVKLDPNSANYKGLMARIDAANAQIVKAMDEIAAAQAAKDAAAAEAKAKEEAAKAEAAALTAAETAVKAVEDAVAAGKYDDAKTLAEAAVKAVAAVKDAEKAAAFNARLVALVPAAVTTVSAVDGTITVDFDKKPATTPAVKDFTVKVKIDAADAKAVTVSAVEVVSDKQVKVTVPAIAETSADQKVVYTVAYLAGTAKEASYTVAAKAVAIKSLTAVVKSMQAVVGADSTVSVKALDADGKPVVNGDVTFNVKQTDLATTVINPTYVVTAKTDANGIATIKVNRPNPMDDTVDAYSTVNPAVRTSVYIYRGVTARLAVTSADADTIANGSYKTYSVSLKSATGAAMAGKRVYVAFAENLSGVQGTPARVAQNSVGAETTPFQTPTGQNATFYVTTDDNGAANFVLKGNNTSVTPIVYYTTTQLATDDVYYTSYLHVDLSKVTFVGAQSTFVVSFTETTPIVSTFGALNGHLYTVNVKNAAGAAYVNGTVTVGLNENIDNVITTNTDAIITDEDGVAMTGVGQPTGVTLQLDSTGAASFYVIDTNVAGLYPTATPVVWIDQNNVANIQGRLETTEPFAVGPSVTFRTETIAGVTMTKENAPSVGNYIASVDTALLAININNQDGNEISTPLSTIAQVTWKIVNNSDAPITVTTNLGATQVAALNTTNVTGSLGALAINTTNANASVIVSAVVTLANNSSFIVPEQTIAFTKVSRQITMGAQAFTGTVLAYDLYDLGDAKTLGLGDYAGCGRIIVKLDGTNEIVAVNYDDTYAYFSGLADVATSSASYNQLVDVNSVGYTQIDKFEKILTVGDRVYDNAAGSIFLQNVDNSSGQSPKGLNGYTAAVVPPTVNYVSTVGTTTASVAAAAGKYYTNALPAAFTGGFTVAASGDAVAVVVAVNNATPAQVAAAINTAATAAVSTITATAVGNQVVITSSVATDNVAVTASTNSTYVPNQTVNATAAVLGVYTVTLNKALIAGQTVTVHFGTVTKVYTAGTDFALGTGVNSQATAIAALITADVATLGFNAAAVGGVITLTEAAASGNAAPTVVTNPIN